MLACLSLLLTAWSFAVPMEGAAPAPSAAPSPAAETKVVFATGKAAVTGADATQAKAEAKTNAMRNAVEQGVGLLISSQTEVQNFQTIQDRILTKASGYCRNVQVLAEEVKEGVAVVKISAEVATAGLEGDLVALQILHFEMESPRVAVAMTERGGGAEGRGDLIANAVSQPLLEKGYQLVDQDMVKTRLKDEVSRRVVGGDAEAAISAGDQLACEYIIAGTGEASAGPAAGEELAGMFPVRASATAKVVRTSNGKLLATLIQRKNGLHAVKEVGEETYLAESSKALGEEAVAKISAAWQDEMNNGAMVQLSVFPLTYDQLQMVKQKLAQIPRVVGVFQRDFTEGGAAKLELKFRGAPSLLAQRVHYQSYEGYQLVVAKERPHALELRFTRGDPPARK